MAYADLLKDPRWQRKRLEKLQEADWKCAMCFSGEKTLNVHHKRYRKGAPPWDCDMRDLEVLCEDCHEAITVATRSLRAIVERGDMGDIFRLSGYALALSAKNGDRVEPVRARSANEVRGIADAFTEASLYGFLVNFGDLLQSRDPIDLVAMAKAESDAMEAAIEKWHKETFPEK